MFRSYYVSTKDRKNHDHNYRLPQGETVPNGEEIIAISVAGQHKFADIIGEKLAKDLKELYGKSYAKA